MGWALQRVLFAETSVASSAQGMQHLTRHPTSPNSQSSTCALPIISPQQPVSPVTVSPSSVAASNASPREVPNAKIEAPTSSGLRLPSAHRARKLVGQNFKSSTSPGLKPSTSFGKSKLARFSTTSQRATLSTPRVLTNNDCPSPSTPERRSIKPMWPSIPPDTPDAGQPTNPSIRHRRATINPLLSASALQRRDGNSQPMPRATSMRCGDQAASESCSSSNNVSTLLKAETQLHLSFCQMNPKYVNLEYFMLFLMLSQI